MELYNKGWSNKEIVTFLNLNGIKRRNKKDDYKVKDIFMCLKKLKITSSVLTGLFIEMNYLLKQLFTRIAIKIHITNTSPFVNE